MGLPDVVGLITARGGSKGLPRKNIAPLAGKPLMAWTIEAALAARTLRRVIVSTDDEEYAAVAQSWGAEVPFLRPAALATDDSPDIDAIVHALDWLVADGDEPQFVVILQPTSPLRLAEDIDAAVTLAVDTAASAVVSVTEAASHPYLTMRISEDGRLADFVPKPSGYLRRQDLPAVYTLNGAIYLVRSGVLRSDRSKCPPGAHAYVMPSERSIDIDTAWDLHLADLILSDRQRMTPAS
jgi:CMP-N-acetylneuraminic acid synthetase